MNVYLINLTGLYSFSAFYLLLSISLLLITNENN